MGYDKNQLFLYEYIKLCNEYFKARNKSLLPQISEMYSRTLPNGVIFNTIPKETRCYCGRIDTESAEDISKLEENDTFTFSHLVNAPVRVWCKDKDKLKKYMEHKLFANQGSRGILITELIHRKNILFDYDHYNTMIATGKLKECFSGPLQESALSEFKPLNIKETVREVLVNADVRHGEVLEVINAIESLDKQKLIDEIKKSLGY